MNEAFNASIPSAPQPLRGLRVIDVGNFLAGPCAAIVMGESGAEVIEVEHRDGGDPMRRFGTPTERPDAALAWLSESRHKRSVTIDLLQPEGVALFLKLVAKCDVLVENFRPGTMESRGLRWEVLREVNPRLVVLRVTGYGQTGPYKDCPGVARVAHAVGGLAYLAGMPKGTPMTPGATTLDDCRTGLHRCLGVMPALCQSVFRCTEEPASAYAMFGTVPERAGSSHSDFAGPHGHFSTKRNAGDHPLAGSQARRAQQRGATRTARSGRGADGCAARQERHPKTAS